MRVLLFDHPTLGSHCERALKRLEHEVQRVTEERFSPAEWAAVMQQWRPDCIITVIAEPFPCELAHAFKVPCAAWIVDHPDQSLYGTAARHPEVQIFHFDRKVAQALEEQGFSIVYHLPPGGDPGLPRPTSDFIADVSFVGNLGTRTSEYVQLGLESWLTPEQRQDYADAIQDALRERSSDPISTLVDDAWIATMKAYAGQELKPILGMSSAEQWTFILQRHFVGIERQHLTGLIGAHSGLAVFGNSDWEELNLDYRGFVRPEDEMHAVFAQSKININITRRLFPSGLPMRVFDILAAGGFLLTNPNEGLLELFEDGVHCAVYRSDAELIEKIDFYLQHDEERQAIAARGRDAIIAHHSYENRLNSLLRLLSI